MLFSAILAFVVGLVTGSYAPFLPASMLMIGIVLGFGALGVCARTTGRLRDGWIIAGSLWCGVGWWTVFAWPADQPDLGKWVGAYPVHVVGAVAQPVRRLPDRQVLIVDLVYVGADSDERVSASGLLRLTWRQADRLVRHGDHVQGMVRLRLPYGTRNPGGFHYGTYLQRQGIAVVGSVSGAEAIRIEPETRWWVSGWWWSRIDGWRAQVQRAAEATLAGPSLGLFLGMIIGEQGHITPAVRDAFMATGTVHIISISGSHLGLIALLVFAAVRGSIRRLPVSFLEWLSVRITATRAAVLATLPCVSLYTLLAGGQIATVRAWMMTVLFLAAVWMGRGKHVFTTLGVAAMVAVLVHPPVVYDISFQLSYLAVLGIACVLRSPWAAMSDPLRSSDVPRSQISWLRSSVIQAWWITLTVTVATVPLVAYYFNQIAWMGLVCNLVVVPFVGVALIPLGLCSALWVILTGADRLPWGPVHMWIADAVVAVVEYGAQVPGAVWNVASPAVLTIVLFYALCVIAMVASDRRVLRAVCLCGLLGIMAWWGWSPRDDMDDSMRVTFLDVGQGDATVVELPDGQTILIDSGPAYQRLDMGRAVVGPFLWDRGIRVLDHVVATHPQWDHVGGLPWVFHAFEVRRFWGNGVVRDRLFYRQLQMAVENEGLQEQVITERQHITTAGPCRVAALRMFMPLSVRSGRAVSPRGAALNNQSIIIVVECGEHMVLLTADAETAALARLMERDEVKPARIVKVPHHGAKSSLHHGWIAQLEADVAVVSAGRYNRYGHPNPSVVGAYAERGIPLYRTDRDGAVWVVVKVSASEMRVYTAADERLRALNVGDWSYEQEYDNWRRVWKQWTGRV